MGLFGQLGRHRKNNRLIVGGLLALLAFLASLTYVLQRGRGISPELAGNRVLLFVLFYVDVILILAIAFVLLRNLFKLLVERHHKILGSQFKTKLMIAFIGLSLIPVLLLFTIATELLQGSVDRWFTTPLAEALRQGRDVAQALRNQVEERNLRSAARALREIAEIDLSAATDRPALVAKVGDLLADQELDFLGVYAGTDFVHGVVNPQSGLTDLPEPDRQTLAEAASEGEAVFKPLDVAGGWLMMAARAAPGRSLAESAGGEPPAPVVVVTGIQLDPHLTQDIDLLTTAYLTHRQIEVQKEEIKASQLLTFLMVTLLILLASSWVSVYLARRVTVPIQALADGTRRISRGDLAHRVDVEAGDELGALVESFNRMTADLQASRVMIEESHRELLETNQRLAQERALIAAVLENVAAGVVSIDAEGTVFLCNGAALKMLHQSEGDCLGRAAELAWGEGERSKLLHLLAQTQPGDRLSEEVHLALGGEWKTLEVKVTTMRNAEGEVTGKVMFLEDMTELIKAQKLAAWNEAARRVAHEIKNPLTPIRLSAERLLRRHLNRDPELGEAVEGAVEIIVREVSAIQGMVDEFSRFARMPRSQPRKVDLEELFRETLHLYRDVKPGVRIASQVAPEARSAWLDSEQIKRALINLLDNAVEATQAPGEISLTAEAANGSLTIRVADTGPGISAEAKKKLFLPYFSTKGRGTGLGLAIVHRIVVDHSGSIRAEDNQPRGTVFTIELPAR